MTVAFGNFALNCFEAFGVLWVLVSMDYHIICDVNA